MAKQPPKRHVPAGSGKRQSSKPPRERQNVYLDAHTVAVLDNLANETPEVENRSAAIRYLCRWYEMTSQGKVEG